MKEKKKQENEEQVAEVLEDFNLDENKTCEEKCECKHEEHECGCHEHKHCQHHEHGTVDEAGQYLAMAQRLQADFENYRKHVSEALDKERQEGIKSVIEVFLPCLDTFGEAKKSIQDESVLNGVNMIENKILEALKTLKVERIETIGNVYNPHLHNVIAVMQDAEKENDIILQEYQSGWTLNGKVIRYAKVIVNKLN